MKNPTSRSKILSLGLETGGRIIGTCNMISVKTTGEK
jgi:hypothetical protein